LAHAPINGKTNHCIIERGLIEPISFSLLAIGFSGDQPTVNELAIK